MEMDFRKVDKTQFQCHQMPDGSVYYGETVHFNPQSNEIFYNLDEVKEEVKKHLKVVRHGWGVQLFGKNMADSLVHYAGLWDRDRKNGQGQQTFPNNDQYKGYFREDLFDGYGQFKFYETGQFFTGYWKEGKMDGGGEFAKFDGQLLQGQFKNNLFNLQNEYYVNPMLDETQRNRFVINAVENKKNQAKAEKDFNERVRLYRVNNASDFQTAMTESRAQNRTMLILTSIQKQMDFYSYEDQFKQAIGDCNFYQISLRDFELEYQQKGDVRQNALEQRKAAFEFALRTWNSQLVLDLEWSSTGSKTWKHMYEPDIDHLVSVDCIPPEIWKPNDLKNLDAMVRSKIIGHDIEEADKQEKFSELQFDAFTFLVWSKFKLNDNLSDEQLLQAFKNRFSKNLPLQSINMVFIQNALTS